MSQHWSFGWDEIAAFANAGAVVVAVLVGRWGVKRWQTERVETRQAELAEKALALMYRAPEVFDHIRSPMAYAGEGQSRPREEGETEKQQRERDSQFVPFERNNQYQEYFQRVIEIRPSIKAIFGRNKAEPLEKILEIRQKILVSAQMIGRLNGREFFHTEEKHREHFDQVKKYQAVIWKGLSDPDEIDAALAKAVSEMESTAEPILRSRLQIAPV